MGMTADRGTVEDQSLTIVRELLAPLTAGLG
jgi:hypothetical protein